MLPLITEKNIALTHLIICSFHINLDDVIHLNDFPPGDTHFNTVWTEAKVMQAAGVKVMGMIGGAAPGAFETWTLDSDDVSVFEHYYGQLRDTIRAYNLDGMDIDVEEWFSQEGITRLVERLYADFGKDFIITLAPVASALLNSGNLSGFDYKVLETSDGQDIDWYNAQFYNGFGDASSTGTFDSIVKNGFKANKVVVGQITTPDNGSGWVDFKTLNNTVTKLRSKYGEIGGIMGWEYFNSAPGGNSKPWVWAQDMTKILRPSAVVKLNITEGIANDLIRAWQSSVIVPDGDVRIQDTSLLTPDVDYRAMINA
jgi:chitinase